MRRRYRHYASGALFSRTRSSTAIGAGTPSIAHRATVKVFADGGIVIGGEQPRFPLTPPFLSAMLRKNQNGRHFTGAPTLTVKENHTTSPASRSSALSTMLLPGECLFTPFFSHTIWRSLIHAGLRAYGKE
jgi:hypothetical protein